MVSSIASLLVSLVAAASFVLADYTPCRSYSPNGLESIISNFGTNDDTTFTTPYNVNKHSDIPALTAVLQSQDKTTPNKAVLLFAPGAYPLTPKTLLISVRLSKTNYNPVSHYITTLKDTPCVMIFDAPFMKIWGIEELKVKKGEA